jgi:mono/diheme cytochrome c family protein
MEEVMIKRILPLALLVAMPVFAASPDPALYKSKCASCHGADGSGQTPVGKSMKVRDLRSAAVQKQTDLELTKIIAGGKGKMPAFGKQFSTAQIEGLIAHIRTLKAK